MMYRASKLLPAILCAALLWGVIPIHAFAGAPAAIPAEDAAAPAETAGEDEDSPDANAGTPSSDSAPESEEQQPSGQPDASKQPEQSEQPGPSELPEQTGQPGPSELPEQTEQPGPSELPEQTDAPGQASETPSPTDEPQPSELPEEQPEDPATDENSELAAAAAAERPSLTVRRTDGAPVIDGALEDTNWSIDQPLSRSLTAGEEEANSPQGAFGVLWDHQYLYIGVRAEDSTPLQDMPGYWFEQDNMNLFVDPTLHRSAPFSGSDLQAGFVYRDDSRTPAFSFGAALSGHAGKDDKDILRAIHKTDTGWELEAAISWELLAFDPRLSKELGLEVSVTDRYGSDTAEQRTSYWSAYQSASFWNDTSGYGTLTLSDSDVVQGPSNPVLLEESFDGVPDGSLPAGWISDTGAGSPPFAVSGGRMAFDGNASGKQSRVTAPVQWDHYVVEADVQFHSVLNAARWASLMFRGTAEGKHPYNQMAIRQNGTYEVAYRKPDNAWSVMASGPWKPLALNETYTMKVRVFDNNVKEYIKHANDADFSLLVDRSFDSDLLKRGKVGFQADQSSVSFDNLKVTRLTAAAMELGIPAEMEALSGPIVPAAQVTFSDGVTENVTAGRLKLYSSDENVLKVVGGELFPVREGGAVVTAVYANLEVSAPVTVKASATGAKVVSLEHDTGYVLATVGSPLALGELSFAASFSDFTNGTVKGDAVRWSSSEDKLELSEGSINVLEGGVHRITGEIDGVTISMLIVAKSAEESGYVLYENNFDLLPDGTMPDGWSRIEGATPSKAAARNGAFELQASASPDNPSRVLLPDYLSLFGDYRIEADITHLAANEPTRWHSLMFRIQNGNYPYYQMAVRQDASAANGVEFAERNTSNGWSVIDKGPFGEKLDSGTMYRYTVVARGNRVQEWINDSKIVDTDSAGAYLKGGIGLQANGSSMKVDNLRVTLQQEPLPPLPADRFADVYEPETKIAMGPTVVMEISDAAQLESLSKPETPATVILHVDDALRVTNPAGTAILANVSDVVEQLEGRIIPAFYVTSESAADAVAMYAKTNGLEDAFVVSADGALIKRARTIMPMLRGILDFSHAAGTGGELLDIRRETTSSGSKIAILPEAAASEENAAYLQQRTIVVWSKEDASRSDSSLSKHRLIATGTNGIVTDSPETAFEALRVYNHAITLIREPYIIGHRGMPSKSPENTIESNLLAYESGADFIENDMYVTVDGHLVIIHDAVLQNTTNGTGSVESFTLEEIKQLNANKPYPNGFPLVRVPTLEEQIELAREKGIMLYAEIKTGNPKAVDALVRVIREQDAEDMINVMSFNASQLRLFAEQMPGMPVGLLVGSGSETDVNVGKALRDTLRATQQLNATYNAGFIGMGQQYMEASKHRGIIISPWTINGLADYTSFFLRGAFGITTDYAYYSEDWNVALEAQQESYSVKSGDKLTLKAVAETYSRHKHEVAPDLVWLDGQELFDTAGGELTAKFAGTAHLMLRYTTQLEGNHAYDLYSAPISIEVKSSGSPGSPGGVSGNEGSPDNGCEQPQPGSGVIHADAGSDCSALIRQAFASNEQVEVRFTGHTFEVDAGAWPENSRTEESMLVISNELAVYRFPAALWNPKDWEKLTGRSPHDLTVRFTMKKLEGRLLDDALAALAQSGGTLVSDILEFEAELTDAQGGVWPVPFGARYAVREMKADSSVDGRQLTALQYMPETGMLHFVPAAFAESMDKTGTIARLKRNGNSIYMLAAYDRRFDDMAGHWAQDEVALAANKGLVLGKDESAFAPEDQVTRAEFATMLVRALGLSSAEDGSGFRDVPKDAWYAKDIAAAEQAGLIFGYEDRVFKPEAFIRREEAAAMLMRALAFAGAENDIGDSLTKAQEEQFRDAHDIVWANEELAAALSIGLMKGTADGYLLPQRNATRAEAAALLIRFLEIAKLI
ncbi:S-layer homology domain-containing protein [Paenibacillus soyae]|uniref:S-layer homology domain-containing protein n=1 Tax=Paenibacillus soyae TaxID=2969249 RepID=A0A9X2SBH3_9BACL|nr:S-layer homology domain-containing protein [Paenibacillus soyae]MCR2804847.1 S-layer homology domain-containing protein [Paenibacillus soyae]